MEYYIHGSMEVLYPFQGLDRKLRVIYIILLQR